MNELSVIPQETSHTRNESHEPYSYLSSNYTNTNYLNTINNNNINNTTSGISSGGQGNSNITVIKKEGSEIEKLLDIIRNRFADEWKGMSFLLLS